MEFQNCDKYLIFLEIISYLNIYVSGRSRISQRGHYLLRRKRKPIEGIGLSGASLASPLDPPMYVVKIESDVTIFPFRWWNSKSPLAFQAWKNHLYGGGMKIGNIYYNWPFDCVVRKVFSKDRESWRHPMDDYPEKNDKLNTIKQYAMQNMQPMLSQDCSLLMLSNLAYLEWISINCNEAILSHIVCVKNRTNILDQNDDVSIIATKRYCDTSAFLHHDSCYLFTWFDGFKRSFLDLNEICRDMDMINYNLQNIAMFKRFTFIFNAFSVPSFTILSRGVTNQFVTLYVFEKYWLKKYYSKKDVEVHNAKGYIICHRKPKRLTLILENIYKCKSGRFISAILVCDNSNDCADGEDEKQCTCESFQPYCKTICKNSKCSCSYLHYETRDGKCDSYKIPKVRKLSMKEMFMCADGTTIFASQVSDLVSDCGSSADDEEIYKNLLLYDEFDNCTSPGQIPCTQGHSKCFNISDTCIFRLNSHNNLIPCRTGTHLENCEMFECNTYYKCPGYYCIPFAYVCNGNWDCPDGADESQIHGCGYPRSCNFMFKCMGSQICTHLTNICDGQDDCPFRDDEEMCILYNHCPHACTCFHYAVLCVDISIKSKELINLPYISYTIIFTDLETISFLKNRQIIQNLNVSRNKIGSFCPFPRDLKVLKKIDMSWNIITNILSSCFYDLPEVQHIYLNNNKLSQIESKSFVYLNILCVLDISNNNILKIAKDTFIKVSVIHKLKLFNNPLTKISFNTFNLMSIKGILTNDYHLCCIAPPHVICTAKKPWYASCSTLFSNNALRYTYSFTSITLMTINVLFALRTITELRKNPKYVDINLLAIRLAEIIYGIHLTVIWVADTLYNDIFVLHETEWRANGACLVAVMLSVCYSMVSPFIFVILACNRYLTIRYPFEPTFKSIHFVSKCLFIGLVTSLCISGSITLYFSVLGIVPSPLCSGFTDPLDSRSATTIVTGIVGALQVLAWFLTTAFYSLMIKELHHLDIKNKAMKTVNVKSKITKTLMMEVITMQVLNFASWIPTNIIYISTLFLSKYPKDLPAWTAIVFAPINSVVLPLTLIIIFKSSKLIKFMHNLRIKCFKY